MSPNPNLRENYLTLMLYEVSTGDYCEIVEGVNKVRSSDQVQVPQKEFYRCYAGLENIAFRCWLTPPRLSGVVH